MTTISSTMFKQVLSLRWKPNKDLAVVALYAVVVRCSLGLGCLCAGWLLSNDARYQIWDSRLDGWV